MSACIDTSVAAKTGFDIETQIRRADGAVRDVRSVGECETDGGGRVTGLFGVIMDITDQRTAARALAEAEQRQADFSEMAWDWMWEMGPDLRFTYKSDQVDHILGIPASYHIGKSRQELIGDAEMSLEMEMHLMWLEQHKAFRDFRYWHEGPDGVRRYVSTSGKPVFDGNGGFRGYRGSSRDLTEEQAAKDALLKANRELKAANKEKSDAMGSLKEANALLEEQAEEMLQVQQEIQHTALHDPLTGIANRRYLDERLTELAARCRREDGWLAALHIDLDRFKQINDTAGHAAGDALLVHVSDTLVQTVRQEDFVARVGGDEFVVLCTDYTDQKVLSIVAERIIQRLSQPFVHDGRECWFGASIGIAAMKGDEIETGELLVNADIALYRAKSRGRGRYEYFSAEVQAEIIRNKETADGIRVGLTRGEFIPFYQAQIAAQTFEIAGFEALARWEHPEKGILAPNAFLGIAEDLNVVAQIDRQVLERTLKDHAYWQELGLSIPKLSVNVSARRLLEEDLISGLLKLDMPKGVISFELLESVFLDDPEDRIIWNIDMLKEMGVDVELDDFGSGHASLISLVKLAPDAIKIDQELISTITTDPARRNLVKSIIEIGKSLDVRVVAEGVETMGHALQLRDLGCDILQGYVFSHPLAPYDVPNFVRSWVSGQGGATGPVRA